MKKRHLAYGLLIAFFVFVISLGTIVLDEAVRASNARNAIKEAMEGTEPTIPMIVIETDGDVALTVHGRASVTIQTDGEVSVSMTENGEVFEYPSEPVVPD